jgi:hypothetical protein
MPRRKLNLSLIDPLNTRVSGTNPLPASSGVVGVGVVGTMIVGQSIDPSSKDARYVNCYKQSAGQRAWLVKRSGVSSLQTVSSGLIGTAVMVWSGQGSGDKRISAFGGVSSNIYDSSTLIATNNSVSTNLGTKCTSISETVVNNNPVLYLTGSDNSGWFYDTTISSVIVKISDAQFPGNNGLTLAGYGAHMDGYTFQMDTRGAIHNSDLNTISSYTASGNITASIYPDKGIGCVRWKQYIIGFGPQSMEFFYNAGNATGSPLSRIANMAQRVGAVHADAIAQIADTLFFCGSTSEGGLSIYQFDGQVQRISPPQLDSQLILAGAGNIKMTALRDSGMSFIDVKAGGTIYRYCIEEKFWGINLSSLGFVRWAALSSGTSQVVYGVSETSISGKMYTINPASRTFQDDGMVFSLQAYKQSIDPGEGEHVTYEEVEVVADVESTDSPATITWSDDDYQTFANGREVNLSTRLPYITRCGGTKHPRAFAVTHGANTPARFERLRLTVKTGR